MSMTRLIAPLGVTRSSSPWFESIGYKAPSIEIMLYHVPSGSKSSSSGFATGFAAWKALRSAITCHAPPGPTLITPLGTSGTPCEHPVKLLPDEGDARDAAHKAADGRAGLARREGVHDRRDDARRADLRDAAAQHRVVLTACVRCGRAGGLGTLSDGRVGAAETALGHIEVSVWAERQAARIVEAGREDRDARMRG